MASDLISVIVPIYKVEKYLPKCVESILNQTYTNLEIILVDDGSPDNCGNICEEYAKKDARIKVIHKVNGGLSDARNAGIEIASGEYLGFVDSDDFIHPKMYESLYNAIIENGAEVSICTFQNVAEDENIEYCDASNLEWNILKSETDKFYYSFDEKTSVTAVVAWNKLYKKELFSGIRYPYGKIHEDEFTTYKLLEKADKIACTQYPFYYYLQRAGSIMNNGFDKRSLYRLDAYKERLELYQSTGRYDWYESIMFLYKYFLVEWSVLILSQDKEKMEWLKPYKKYYNQQIFKYILKLPRRKKSYLFYALFSKIYLKRIKTKY